MQAIILQVEHLLVFLALNRNLHDAIISGDEEEALAVVRQYELHGLLPEVVNVANLLKQVAYYSLWLKSRIAEIVRKLGILRWYGHARKG